LTTKPEHFVSLKEALIVEECLSANPHLAELYQALQALRRIFNIQSVKKAQNTLKSWFNRYLFSFDGVVQKSAKANFPIINFSAIL
jgi:hypothetical protein